MDLFKADVQHLTVESEIMFAKASVAEALKLAVIAICGNKQALFTIIYKPAEADKSDISLIIFATNNQHKLTEIQAAIGHQLKVIGLMQAGIHIDIPEPHDTLEANATEKSRTIYQLTGRNCFSEDTGLEVVALNGEPGAKSARYAGQDRDFEKNVDKLLARLEGATDRRARFRTVISLIWEGEEFLFEGICEGVITAVRRGNHGFGYDPVFQPLGSDRSFAEMSLEEKNSFSHRRKAADKLVLFLQNRLTSLTT